MKSVGNKSYGFPVFEAGEAEPPVIPTASEVKTALEDSLPLLADAADIGNPVRLLYLGVDGQYALYNIRGELGGVKLVHGGALTYVWQALGGSYDIQFHTGPTGYSVTNEIQYYPDYTCQITGTLSQDNQSVGMYVAKYGKTTGRTAGHISNKYYHPSGYSATFYEGLDYRSYYCNKGQIGGKWMMYKSLGFKGSMDLPGSIRRILGIGKFRAKVFERSDGEIIAKAIQDIGEFIIKIIYINRYDKAKSIELTETELHKILLMARDVRKLIGQRSEQEYEEEWLEEG